MKYFFFIFLIIITAGAVHALEYNAAVITDCAGPITVNITGALNIDPAEYVVEGCVENGTNVWQCICNTTTEINITVQENTVNTYDAVMTYQAYRYVTGADNGGGGSGYYPTRYTNVTNVTINKTINMTTPTTPQTPPIQTPPAGDINISALTEHIQNDTTPTISGGPQILTILKNFWEWIRKILLYKLW